MKLAGKVVVITGAANGLGKALAYEFSAQESQVVASDVDRVGLASLQNELPNLTTVAADVSNHDEVENLLRDAIKIHGQVDVWINNAGVRGPDDAILSLSYDDLEQVFRINALGLIDGSMVAAKYLESNPGGWIVNVLSTTAMGHWLNHGLYVASKFAGRGFTLSMQKELKLTKVLGVYPDGMKTELFGDVRPKNYEKFLEPGEIAQKIVQAIAADDDKDLIIRR